MADESKKRDRTSAKRLFTRATNSLQKAIDDSNEVDIITNRFKEVRSRWMQVQESHERYMETVNEEEEVVAQEDDWILELQERFEGLEVAHLNAVRNSIRKENESKSQSAEMEKERELKEKISQQILITERLHQRRAVEEITFNGLVDKLSFMTSQVMSDDNSFKAMSVIVDELKKQFEVCKESNGTYIDSLEMKASQSDLQWITTVQERYLSILQRYIKCERLNENLKISNRTVNISRIKLEPMKYPIFSGDIRTYPRFKSDFQKYILPELASSDAAAYVLRSCLHKSALEIVTNVDDDIEQMWLRLDEKFGQPAKLVDLIMCDIKAMKSIPEGDDKKLIELVDTVERGYRDLKRIKLERELSNVTVLGMIESILPKMTRREWSREVQRKDSSINEENKFDSFLEFLLEQKRIVEYHSDYLRTPMLENKDFPKDIGIIPKCLIHKNGSHKTEECSVYLNKSSEDRVGLVRQNAACFTCLLAGHNSSKCPSKRKCSDTNCERFHHHTLHGAQIAGIMLHSMIEEENLCSSKPCLLQVMKVSTNKYGTDLNVLWDGGATDSLITFSAAAKLKLNGRKMKMAISKVGGEIEAIDSCVYQLPLRDSLGNLVMFNVYGIEKISSPLQPLNTQDVASLFEGLNNDQIHRPEGEVDALIGLDYAAFHPQIRENVKHLVLLQNQFGKCLSGRHPLLTEKVKKIVSFSVINHFCTHPCIKQFFSIESMGTNSQPRCGNCKCGTCALGGKDFSLKDEREMMMIERGLEYVSDHWVSSYPWVRDPSDLPDNRMVALAILRTTEKRLLRNRDVAEQYKEQMSEMVEKGVARKLSHQEMELYKGPCHYVSHHEVIKRDSTSTPLRIVFNSSANFKGHILNEYWAKGPDFINNLLGILLRFRENYVAFVGDIKRMYHTIKLSELDQHTHRYLWRNLETTKPIETFVMTSVCFGDKPSSAIASLALRKSVGMNREKYPEAERIVVNNTYVDDIVDSVDSEAEARKLTKDIEASIQIGAFKVKSWTFTGDSSVSDSFFNDHQRADGESQKVLGIRWNPNMDVFYFTVKINFSPKKRNVRTGPDLKKGEVSLSMPKELTKRMILSQVNSLYDPVGLVVPVTVRSKMLMRNLWVGENKKLGWDDPIPAAERDSWRDFFCDLIDVEKLSFSRCVKPPNAVADEHPVIILFSDASEKAFGCCAYIRWKLTDGTYKSSLLSAKSRVAPINVVSIVRLELNGALLAKRLKTFIDKEVRIQFRATYFLVDSRVVLAMVQKDSLGFRSYAAVRIGEIQQSTNTKDWYWIESSQNIADWTSRGRKPDDLRSGSEWQDGPKFLELDEKDWPMKQNCDLMEVPELIHVHLEKIVEAESTEKLSDRININRFSSYLKLIFTTARVLSLYHRKPSLSFRNVLLTPTSADLENAIKFWVMDAQSVFTEKMIKDDFSRLSPKFQDDGILVVGTRVEKWLLENYNREGLILLPRDHGISKLYAMFVHNICHSGISSTVSKIRRKFWIVRLTQLVKSIVNKCVPCKLKRKQNAAQLMSSLPLDRLKPAPAWNSVAMDYFGPIDIRGEVNKRSRGTCFGVIFNSLEMRGVHLDIVNNCSTDSFLMALRRFATIRGWPVKMLSDNGSQFKNASKKLKEVVKSLDWETIKKFGAEKGIDWKFTPADSPWHNGCSEALVKSTKLAIKAAIKDQTLTYAELQTVVYEAAGILNERPIGSHPNNPDEGSYLCPNDLLLGRASSRIPGGPFQSHTSLKQRYEFVESIVDSFWRKMTRDFFPSLLIRPKWHVQKRNISPRDIVIIQDSNALRGEWKLGRVTKVTPSDDGLVRKCQVRYKNKLQNGEMSKQFTYVERSVQRLVVILPVDDQ